MNNSIIAGIVTFNPDIDRLVRNVNSIKNQVDQVVLVDNGSNEMEMILSLLNDDEKVVFICNDANVGIATALNQVCQWACDRGYRWCITLDQDSVCPIDYVNQVSELLDSDELIGQIVPLLFESKSMKYCYLGCKPNGAKFQEVHRSITSASITKIDAWNEVGKFDDDLFIDYVDYDFNVRLIKAS